MNYDLIFAVIFYGLIYIYYLKHKDKFEVQSKIFALYKTKLGLKLMEKISKISPKFLRFIGNIGILVGFMGMFLILYMIVKGTFDLIKNLLLHETVVSTIAPVIPGVEIAPGLPILNFWHWIIAILIVAVIHEFSHGVFAKLHKVKIKSSGFAFLGPILAAFVEPDEKMLNKKNKKQQLSIYAAGPFSNIIFAFIIFLTTLFIFSPLTASLIEPSGLYINHVEENLPANLSGIQPGTIILGINNNPTLVSQKFIDEISKVEEGESILVNTNKENYTLTPIFVDDKPKIGVSLIQKTDYKKNISKFAQFSLIWIFELLGWLFLISLGIGLFNLLPLGPIDGGRMLLTGLLFFTNKEKAHKIWKAVSIFCLVLIAINLLWWIYSFILTLL